VVDFLVAQGIERERLEARGYGKRVPRVIEKELVRDGFTFPAQTVLTETYINSLPTEEHRDAAHQLNRRTEFRVIRDDYEPPEREEPE
jgi:peptidoglycan-associated lipoprotein